MILKNSNYSDEDSSVAAIHASIFVHEKVEAQSSD